MAKIKEKYVELSKKLHLPDFEELNFEFEIDSLESDSFIMRQIIKKIAEKVNEYAARLEQLLHPETTYASLFECKFFDDEKRQIMDLHRELMLILRKAEELCLGISEKEEAEFISDSLKKWKSLKPELKRILIKLRDCWNSSNTEEESVGYFG